MRVRLRQPEPMGPPASPPAAGNALFGSGAPPSPEENPEATLSQLGLPSGFSLESATDAVTATGTAGQVNPMVFMIGPGGEGPPPGLQEGFGDFMEYRSDGFMLGGGGPGMMTMPVGNAVFMPAGGRIAMFGMRGNRLRGQVFYSVGGSALDAAPYPLSERSDDEPGYAQQRFGVTFGGPLKIAKLFDAGPQTTFFLNYSGNHGSTLQERYATVPTAGVRDGDFSAFDARIIDPRTGFPFDGNGIPADRLDPSALSLLQYLPLPNAPGTTRNFRYTASTVRHSDDINFRFIRTFGSEETRGPGGQGRGGPRGGMGFRGGPGGRQVSNLNVGFHYQRSTGDQLGTFPTTAGKTEQSGWDIPANYAFGKWGMFNTLRVHFNRQHNVARNLYAFDRDVAGDAGITGVSTDPFAWGIPSLSFSTYTSLRDVTPSERTDQILTLALTQTKLRGSHTLRWGADFRLTRNDTRTDTDPRGSFVFTGLYGSGGATLADRSGLDFADFLLGLSQQASIQYGPGLTRYRSRAWSLFLQDDWRVRGNVSINAGLRYEYTSPFAEADDRLVNLDVTPDFTAAVPVIAGGVGPFTGEFPIYAFEPDRNNFAPRVGIAWRPRPRTSVRGGYALHYSLPTYAALAQRLAGQPPFAVSDTRLGGLTTPLLLADAFAGPGASSTTNNFGVDRNYRLGYVQMWNLDVQRDLTRTLIVSAGYNGTKGSSLDLQRAPNRGPLGPSIPGVAPFIWASPEGRSLRHALTVRVRRRPGGTFGGGLAYTFSKALDNASTLGGGGVIVAQDDRNLDAEWGLSSFDQRHRLMGDLLFDLPFGPNKRWLNEDSARSRWLGGWTLTANVMLASGNPLTARILGSSLEVSRGTNGTLRADATGEPVSLDDPTIQQFFNTSAFTLPATGRFGNAGRNTIPGPGTANVSMGLMKNIPLGATRGLTVRLQANNVFNAPQFATVDTVVNSPTFGQVVAMRPMRTIQITVRTSF